jgi:hypothetical protein
MSDDRGLAALRLPDEWQKRRGDLRRSRSQTAKRKRAFVCHRH